jgi:RimJ/RimL family protein N-acetyltransferase
LSQRSDVLIGRPRELLFDWLHQRVGLTWSDDFTAIGRVVNGELVGVVGFNSHNGSSCQMHMAGEGKHWATRKFITEIFRYAFDTLGYQVVFGVVPSGNPGALAINYRLGFKELATIPSAHPDGALHIVMMRREDCRWFGGANHENS